MSLFFFFSFDPLVLGSDDQMELENKLSKGNYIFLRTIFKVYTSKEKRKKKITRKKKERNFYFRKV